jgi:hypothetical protein
MYKILILSLIVAVSGCASTPSLNTTPLNISESELPKYWTWPEVDTGEYQVALENGKCVSYIPNFNHLTKKYENYLKLEFLIDSNGKQFDHKIIENKGGALYNWIDAMTAGFFLPGRKELLIASESNVTRQPVISKRTVFIENAECFDLTRTDKRFEKMGITFHVDSPKSHTESITIRLQAALK